jgi:acyl carrier protein
MAAEQIIKELQVLFKDILDNDDIVLTEATNANDIDEWDSLSNIQLIVAIEKFYKIKFNTQEINAWKNIGDLVKTIESKKG